MTQTPSPAPDLVPAENERQNLTGNSHSDWYNKPGHVTGVRSVYKWLWIPQNSKLNLLYPDSDMAIAALKTALAKTRYSESSEGL
jgi:hypothetical protein